MSKTWSYRPEVSIDQETLIGYDVVATDGRIGEVTDESVEVGTSYIVVDTGFWILDKKRLIPAGAITCVDHGERELHLDMTKDEIKAAPDFVEESRIVDHDDDPSLRDIERYFLPWV